MWTKQKKRFNCAAESCRGKHQSIKRIILRGKIILRRGKVEGGVNESNLH